LIAPEWKELKVKANLSEIERGRDILREMLQGMRLAEEELFKLELALHEALVNIVLHAYPEENGDITIRFRIEGGVFCVEIRDRGIPFNPDEAPDPDLEEKISSGTGGGLGIFLFKILTDGYAYKRDGDENILTLRKRINPLPEP
jgi:anti-sigma regulatory factor (Ser/Thr protein kinase)